MKMQFKRVDTKATIDYTLDCQKDDVVEDKAIFSMRTALTLREREAIKLSVIESPIKAQTIALNIALVDWKNIQDENGKNAKLIRANEMIDELYRPIAQECLDMMPDYVIKELTDWIWTHLFLSEHQRKN